MGNALDPEGRPFNTIAKPWPHTWGHSTPTTKALSTRPTLYPDSPEAAERQKIKNKKTKGQKKGKRNTSREGGSTAPVQPVRGEGAVSQKCGQDQREGVRNERGGISNSVFESLVAAQLRGGHFKGGSLSCFATLPPTSRRWYQPGHSEVTHVGGGRKRTGLEFMPFTAG